jgi:hypothetical protein
MEPVHDSAQRSSRALDGFLDFAGGIAKDGDAFVRANAALRTGTGR